jgi:thiamine-phosphate pyrophosphorylase
MAAQIFLLTPAAADPETFPKTLMAVLGAAEISAMLVRRGDRDEAGYAAWVKTVVNIGQGAGCAVLVEDDAALARRLGADGVHVSGDPRIVADAVKALKPNLIVGAGPFATRHDAMTIGEMDVDYLFFGPLDGPASANAVDLAAWWAQTFEIPAVLSDPTASGETADAHGAEFLALGDSLWSAPEPHKTIAAIAAALEQN